MLILPEYTINVLQLVLYVLIILWSGCMLSIMTLSVSDAHSKVTALLIGSLIVIATPSPLTAGCCIMS